MNSKKKKHPKSHFTNLKKCVFMLFVFLAFVGTAPGQSSSKDKSKNTKNNDTLGKTKVISSKTEKAVVITDTVKKAISFLDQKQIGIDSLFLGAGKFKLYKKGAHASYYADKFHNKKTASGKRYNKNKYSAAHKKLPFGTVIRVTNEANGKSVLVEITDRGPFIRSREIDLSKKAFFDLTGNKGCGKLTVTLELFQK
jgi:rare lipoprotein A